MYNIKYPPLPFSDRLRGIFQRQETRDPSCKRDKLQLNTVYTRGNSSINQ